MEKLQIYSPELKKITLHEIFNQYRHQFGSRNAFFKDVLASVLLKKKLDEFEFREFLSYKEWFDTVLDRVPQLNEVLNAIPIEIFSIHLPDNLFSEIIKELGLTFEFTLKEEPLSETSSSICPDILGYIHENTLWEENRLRTGVFFTPPAEIDFMCRQALYYWLSTSSELSNEQVLQIVFDFEIREASKEVLTKIIEMLGKLRILDPACGSGSFLTGMIMILKEIQEKLHDLMGKKINPSKIIRQIIQESIHGIEIQTWSLMLTKLRLFLMSISQESNIDLGDISLTEMSFNLLEGDALIDDLNWNGTKFDIIIGNPPYVEKEKIVPSNITNPSNREIKQYKKGIIQKLNSLWNENVQVSGRSDYCMYFFYHFLARLKPRGILCFITTNSWLDTEYGRKFQEFLLTHVKILTIINPTKKTFDAEINTIITFLQAPKGSEVLFSNSVRFIHLRSSFKDVISKKSIRKFNTHIDTAAKPEWKEIQVEQGDLFKKACKIRGETGTDTQYFGLKWGTYFFHAPNIFHIIIEKNAEIFIQLGAIQNLEVNEGKSTGANEFFYPLQETARKYSLEAEFLKLGLKTTRDVRSLVLLSEQVPRYFFYCPKSREELQGTKALGYIRWAERTGINQTKTLSRKKEWWKIPVRIPADLILPCGVGTKHFCTINDAKAITSNSFTEIRLKDKEYSHPLWIFFNSIVGWLFMELFGKRNLGGGLLKIDPTDYRQIPVIRKEFFQEIHLETMLVKTYQDLPLQDTMTRTSSARSNPFDEIIFDILKLNEKEQKHVFRATRELIEKRHQKAKRKLRLSK